MSTGKNLIAGLVPLGFLLSSACGTDVAPEADTPGANVFALMVDQLEAPQDLALDHPVTGTFDRTVRVVGFVFEARAGATVQPKVTTQAGSDAHGSLAGAPLDTIAAVFGPMDGDEPGARIAQEDDSVTHEAALPPISIAQDGKYLLVFSSWNDPGTDGRYSAEVTCSGTDFQCTRPVPNDQCVPGTKFVTGGTIIGTEHWKECEVVLLERVEVAQNAVLTISPGVTVKGNYIGTGPYGEVALVVKGTLQAVGTKELPVHFTAYKQGWKGVVIQGSSSTLDQVFIEKALVGLELNGSNNTVRNTDINSGGTAIVFGAGSVNNNLSKLRISKVENGLRFGEGSSASVDDSVILGVNRTGYGVQGTGAGLSHIRRSFLSGFSCGLHLTRSALEMYDTTITGNTYGVLVTGATPGVHPTLTGDQCPVMPYPAPVYSPPPPPYYYYDPVFVRCDLVANTHYAIRLEVPELLVVEDSNVTHNGSGIFIEADQLHQDSRILRNNIYANTAPVQLDTFHLTGTLRMEGNYWEDISDPELSANWLRVHTRSATCVRDRDSYYNGCYAPFSYATVGGRNVCTYTQSNATFTSNVQFTGFSPVKLNAGPDESTLTPEVLAARHGLP